MRSLYEHLNEGVKTLKVKRKYGIYDSISVGEKAPVRNEILAFVAEKENGCTKEELKEFLETKNQRLGTNTTMSWVTKNEKYFKKSSYKNVDESGNIFKSVKFRLSALGKRVLNKLNLGNNEI